MMFGKRTVEPVAYERPSTHRQDPSQRTNMYPGPDEDYATDVEVEPEEYGFTDSVEPPIPVYLVGAAPQDRTYRDWSAGTFTADTSRATQIASYDRHRLRLRVRNLDETNSVFVVRSATDLNHTGFKIPAGETEEFLHNGGVYVRAETADVEVSVYAEFEIDEFQDDDKT
jgi:hypothetical protein